MRTPCLAAALILAATSAASFGQIARPLLKEGDALAGGTAGTPNVVNCNHAAGWAVRVDSSNSLSHVFGSAGPGPGAILRTESTVGPYVQTSFEGFFGISNSGQIAYSPTISPTIDSVFVDNTPIAVGGEPCPSIPGQNWTFGSRPGITANGTIYWAGGVAVPPSTTTSNRGLFYSAAATPLILGGMSYPNLPGPVTGTGIDFDYRFSADGSQWVQAVVMTGQPTTADTAMMRTGAGMLIAGQPVIEGSLVPVAAGGNGTELWSTFAELGINNAGRTMLVATTNAAAAVNGLVLYNDRILFREGDVVAGATLIGPIEEAYMNEQGDVVVSIPTNVGTRDSLIMRNRLLIAEGDTVDFDGDGTLDAGRTISDIQSVAVSSRIGGRVDVYFSADVDILGTTSTTDDVDVLFRLPVCLVDLNQSGSVTVQDLFDFLGFWFANDARADYNNDGAVSVQDIFDYLAGWFAGC